MCGSWAVNALYIYHNTLGLIRPWHEAVDSVKSLYDTIIFLKTT